MLAEIIEFGPTIKLVPHSGIQFVEYAFNIDKVGRLSRRFLEREAREEASEEGPKRYHLIPGWSDEDKEYEEPARTTDHEYIISERAALDIFLEKWVPIPMLRVKAAADGSEDFDLGPTNWARIRVVADPDRKPGSPITHRAIIAFDTDLMERRPNRPYASLSTEDAANEHEFRFAYRYRDIAWFLGATTPDADNEHLTAFQDWVPAWLNEMFRDFKIAQRGGRPLREDELQPLEHYARYLVFLEYLQLAIQPRTIRLIDTVSIDPLTKPVWVDLVLDVGNSRTCGILIESHPNDDDSDLNNALVLALRDLSEPEKVYTEPFESHVELSSAEFGPYNISVRSSRNRAFFWPSPVRVGPEAARYRQSVQGNEATTGLSSPKRYLSDIRSVNQDWRYPDENYARNGTGPLVDRVLRQFVNMKGDVLQQLEMDRKRYGFQVSADDRIGATSLKFSRSSFFTFMLLEIITHAVSMINNAAVRERRKNRDAPRKLRRIILTVPPAMAVQEQRILRSRTEGAVKLLWQMMGWHENPPPGFVQPEVKVTWDEASCVQFVYLYGEIHKKLSGSIQAFMRLVGRERPFAEADSRPSQNAVPEPSVRIASLDIGGGTTDLMITTYYRDGYAIKPVQNFREGFRIAGDDILKGIVERIVIPAIEQKLLESGVSDPRILLTDRFGGDRPGMPVQEIHLRRQFVLRVLEPIARRILMDGEEAATATSIIGPTRSFAEFFTKGDGATKEVSLPEKRLLDFLEEAAHRRGGTSFSLEECSFTSNYEVIEQAVESVLSLATDNLCEAIHELDCDVLLLSGRPSRLPALVNLVVNKLSLSPDRVIPLHQYQAGNWYPFRSRDNRRIGDPKTTTVVGGMLCVLAESQLPNFTIYTDRLGLRSTAKYIGQIENDGRLFKERVLFENIDLDAKATQHQRPTFKYFTQMRLGYRQLPLERWIASPLYKIRMRPGLDTAQIKIPLDLTLERSSDDVMDGEGADALIRSESMKEDFRIVDAIDANGIDVSRKMELIFNTLDNDQGYWLDTGILSVA